MTKNTITELLPDGHSFIENNCPELHKIISLEPVPIICAADFNKLPEENQSFGFQDNLHVRDIRFDTNSKCLKAASLAGFKEKKEEIIITSNVFDSKTGKSLNGWAVEDFDTNTLSCEVSVDLSTHHIENDFQVYVKTSFYWTEIENGKKVMKSHEEIRHGGICPNDDIVNKITVDFPNTKKLRDYTVILYNRTSSNVEDPDKVYPGIGPIGNKLPFHIPFEGKVKVNKGKIVGVDKGKIVGVDKEKSCIQLEHPINHTKVTFNKDKNQNWDDIKWSYEENASILNWSFPDNWLNDLDLKDLSVNSVFDFYACLSLMYKTELMPESIPLDIYIGSDIESSSTHEKIKKVFLQWGCFGKDTMILMEDGSEKIISKIKIGEVVNTGEGSAKVVNIYTGTEDKMVQLETESKQNLLLTKNHPVQTLQGWVNAEDLNAGDKVKTLNGYEPLSGLYILKYDDMVYSLELDTKNQLVANGIIAGDFIKQNQSMGKKDEPKIAKIPTGLTNEFKLLVNQIISTNEWTEK